MYHKAESGQCGDPGPGAEELEEAELDGGCAPLRLTLDIKP